MIYKIQIHKRKIYLKPRPKKDIKKGLVIVLNKPRMEGGERFLTTNIEAGQKEYHLPVLPEGVFIERIFVKKDGGKKNKN